MTTSIDDYPPTQPLESNAISFRGNDDESQIQGMGMCLSRVLIGAVLGWIYIVSWLVQGVDWLAPVLQLDSHPARQTALQAIMIGIPTTLLGWLWPLPRPRAAFRAWAFAALCLLVLSPTRMLPPVASQTVLLLQCVILALLVLGASQYLGRNRPKFQRTNPFHNPTVWSALGLAALAACPWLIVGALGSWLDTIIAITIGLLAGHLVVAIQGATWLRVAVDTRSSSGWILFRGGLVWSSLLLIIASGLSLNGVQLLAMVAMPSIGWTLMAHHRPATPGRSPATSLLCRLQIIYVLALVDSDALSPAIGDPLLLWSWSAAGINVLLGWGMGFASVLIYRRWQFQSTPAWLVTTTAIGWDGALMIYVLLGQPGFYGDRLFVILKSQADLSQLDTSNRNNYLANKQLVYRTLTQHADSSQKSLRTALNRMRIPSTSYYLTNGIEVHAGILIRFWLQQRPEVERVLVNPRLRPLPGPQTKVRGSMVKPNERPWNLTEIRANLVWSELDIKGTGIKIGHADSGVQYDHHDLKQQYANKTETHHLTWYDPWDNTNRPTDPSGHGTHTLGTILGKTTGVAPEAEWIACANLKRNLGNTALYLDCLQFLFAPFPYGADPHTDGQPESGAHIINNSWGCPHKYEGCDRESLMPAVRALRTGGVFLVVSAGNSGPECQTIDAPLAIYDEVTTVGATDQNHAITPFSSLGPVKDGDRIHTKPDVVAPGSDILSTYPNGTYEIASGTSMAGPHVTGTVALMWSANPNLIGDIDLTETILANTAVNLPHDNPQQPIISRRTHLLALSKQIAPKRENATHATCKIEQFGPPRPNNIYGYGMIDTYQAVLHALATYPSHTSQH